MIEETGETLIEESLIEESLMHSEGDEEAAAVGTRSYDVVVVGGGPGGMAAAMWCHRLDLNTVLLEAGAQLGGQLVTLHSKVVDYLGLMVEHGYELVPHFTHHLESMKVPVRLKTRVLRLQSASVSPSEGEASASRFELTLENGACLRARAVIIATGACRRWLHVEGEARLEGRGVSHSSTRDKLLAKGRRIAVVGGGDAAVEGALILAELAEHVTLIHRREAFRARDALLERLNAQANISCRMDTRVISMNGETRLESLTLEQGGKWETFPIEMAFVRIGISPSSALVAELVPLEAGGYVPVNGQQETSCPGLFVVGDVCNPLFSSVANATGQGMIAAKTLQERLK